MTDTQSKELKVRDKKELTSPAEQTKPGRVFTPDVDIFETEKEITLLADMPGVKSDDFDIDLRDNTLTIVGEAESFENPGAQDIMTEYESGKYYRQFTLSEFVDQEKIDARLNDGVLRLTLPKVEKARPKKISVQAA